MQALFSGRVLDGRCDECPREQVVDLALGVIGENAGDDVCEVVPRIDAVELSRLDQRRDRGPLFAAALRAAEERILSGERQRAAGSFDDVGGDLDMAVVQNAGQARPARQRLADGLGELALLTDEAELHAHPRHQRLHHRSALRLTIGAVGKWKRSIGHNAGSFLFANSLVEECRGLHPAMRGAT